MLLTPKSREELCRALIQASNAHSPISKADLSALSALLEHKPEDMTATVEAGMHLADFQARLGGAGQWLPIDPPNASNLTIGDLLAFDLSGPRRFGCGTIRDYVIGIKVALASGEIIKAGGKVVKNVAGYDLCKLFIGARHTLGIIVEATFKLKPRPEHELIVQSTFDSIGSLDSVARQLLELPLEPVILDAHNLKGVFALVTAFAGAREDVEYQLDQLKTIADWGEGSIDYAEEFANYVPTHRISVLPSKAASILADLGVDRFVARLGNGVIYHLGSQRSVPASPNANLAMRVKNAYDPNHIFPEPSL